MGCAQSRIDNEESVARCKERRNLMREAVIARNAFAAGHSGYAMALKNTGAALNDYGHGESIITPELHPPPLDASTQPPPPPPPPIDNLPPPPPPLPNFSSSMLTRAATMPPITMQHRKGSREIDCDAIAEGNEEKEDEKAEKVNAGKGLKNGAGVVGSQATSSSPPRTPDMKPVPPMPESKGMPWEYFFMVENMPGPSLDGEDELVDENDESEAMRFDEAEYVDGDGGNRGDGMHGMEPKTPEKGEENVQKEETAADLKEAKHIEHSKTAPPEFRRAMKVAPTITLLQILTALDDHFLKASESAQEVTKMLEATRLHYHSNFADSRGNFFLSMLLEIEGSVI